MALAWKIRSRACITLATNTPTQTAGATTPKEPFVWFLVQIASSLPSMRSLGRLRRRKSQLSFNSRAPRKIAMTNNFLAVGLRGGGGPQGLRPLAFVLATSLGEAP